MSLRFAAALSCLVLPVCLQVAAQEAPPAVPAVPADHIERAKQGTALFKSDVRALLTTHCLDCHGGQSVKADLDLSTREDLLDSGPVRRVARIRTGLRSSVRPPLSRFFDQGPQPGYAIRSARSEDRSSHSGCPKRSRPQFDGLADGPGLVCHHAAPVAGADPCSQSRKVKKARQYGTRIIAEAVFRRMIGQDIASGSWAGRPGITF